MTSRNIENIYSDFNSTYENNPDFVIDFYGKNSIFFKNISTFKDKEELRHFIELIWRYLNAIYEKSHFSDMVEAVNKFQPIIDKEILRLNAQDLQDKWYYGILFHKGMACYSLRDYKTATPIFKTMKQFDPKNNRFEDWYTLSRYGQKYWIVTTIYIVFTICMVSTSLLRAYIPAYLRLSIYIVGVLLLITNIVCEYYMKRIIRRPKDE